MAFLFLKRARWKVDTIFYIIGGGRSTRQKKLLHLYNRILAASFTLCLAESAEIEKGRIHSTREKMEIIDLNEN
jgi:hypothetical protein